MGHRQLMGITVADDTEVIPPFPCSYMYVDNVDRDPDNEVFIYQSGMRNGRMFPIPSGCYLVDYDSAIDKWVFAKYGGWQAFWRIGGWRVFALKALSVLIILVLGTDAIRAGLSARHAKAGGAS